jgi:hypothetical protein
MFARILPGAQTGWMMDAAAVRLLAPYELVNFTKKLMRLATVTTAPSVCTPNHLTGDWAATEPLLVAFSTMEPQALEFGKVVWNGLPSLGFLARILSTTTVGAKDENCDEVNSPFAYEPVASLS